MGNKFMEGVPNGFGIEMYPFLTESGTSSEYHANEYQLFVYVDGSRTGTGDAGHISVTACDGWKSDPNDMSGQLSIMLRGTESTSPFISVNQPLATDLPSDGATATFDVDPSVLEVGDVTGISLYANDADGFCIKGLSIVSDNVQCGDTTGSRSCNFGSEYFGTGMVLKSKGSCSGGSFVSVLDGDDAPMLPCFGDGFLDLDVGVSRAIVDLSLHSCKIADGGFVSGSALNVVLTGKTSNDGNTFVHTDPLSLSFSEYWTMNTFRRFEINLEQRFETITMAQLSYDGTDDLCVDIVSVNGHSPTYLSQNWIGTGQSAEATSLNAVFKWAVCKTEVFNVRQNIEFSSSEVIPKERHISGLECSNRNRIVSSTCSISQSYETSKTTSFSFAEETYSEYGTTDEYSWGREWERFEESADTNSDDQNFGFSQITSAGGEANLLVTTLSFEGSLQTDVSWTETTGRVETSGSSWGSNEAWSDSTSTTTGGGSSTENVWEGTTTSSVTCDASMDVPPSHSVSYSLFFDVLEAEIRTYADMKLTLCSAMLNGDGATTDDVVIIENIPNTIRHTETMACEVEFDPAQYLENTVSCAEEEKLAISAGATYIPRCQSADSAKYEACQCDIGESWTMGVCWCSDEAGNPTDLKVHQFDGKAPGLATDADVCAYLSCSGGHGAVVQGENADDGELQLDGDGDAEQRHEEGVEDLVDVESINVDMLNNLVMAIFVVAILASVAIVAVIMYVVSKCWQYAAHGKAQSMMYGKPVVKEQELTVVNEVEEEEESQETV